MNKLLNSSKKLRTYNVSSNFNHSVKQVVNIILKYMKATKLVPLIMNNSKQEINFQRLNYSKIKRELNWKPKIKIQEGIKETIRWYKKYYRFLKNT